MFEPMSLTPGTLLPPQTFTGSGLERSLLPTPRNYLDGTSGHLPVAGPFPSLRAGTTLNISGKPKPTCSLLQVGLLPSGVCFGSKAILMSGRKVN